jgi:GNAT superfamily N-acetyltransferase
MPISIRRARAEDADALVALLAELFSIEADFRPDAARQRRGLALLLAAPEEKLVLVAERRPVSERGVRGDARAKPECPPASIVGMVTVQLVVSTAEGGLSALLEDLVVTAAARGAGIGRLLLAAAEGWARGRGASRLQLLADRENAPALGFYGRMGWRSTRLVCLRRGGS